MVELLRFLSIADEVIYLCKNCKNAKLVSATSCYCFWFKRFMRMEVDRACGAGYQENEKIKNL